MPGSDRIIIIGGGIIGLLAARGLRERGREVVVLDAGDGTGSASCGNAGIIAPGHRPIANPALLPRTMELLLDPQSPLYIPPRPDPRLLRWLLAFRRSCKPRVHGQVVEVLNQMSRISREGWQELLEIKPIAEHLRPVGWVEVFCEEQTAEAAAHDMEALHRDGFKAELIDGDELRRRDPAYTDEVLGALVHPDDIMTEPDRLIAGLEAHVLQQGAEVHHGCTVERILASDSECLGVVLEDGEVIEGSQVVLAAGIWSDRLARDHGIRIPMQAAKGYHVMLDMDSPPVIGCVCRETMVGVNPMADGVRVAGTLELSGVNQRMVQHRLNLLKLGSRRYIHGIEDAEIIEEWNGMRPCTADGLPVVGRLPGLAGTWVATGHGMMGVTLGPITARLITELIEGEAPAMDIVPLSPERFA